MSNNVETKIILMAKCEVPELEEKTGEKDDRAKFKQLIAQLEKEKSKDGNK